MKMLTAFGFFNLGFIQNKKIEKNKIKNRITTSNNLFIVMTLTITKLIVINVFIFVVKKEN